jgi:hypothetical protein
MRQNGAMPFSPRLQRFCRTLAFLFILAIAVRVAALAVPINATSLRATPVWGCDICDLRGDLLMLARSEASRGEIDQRMLQQMERPKVAVMLHSARFIQFAPFFALFASLALAFRSLASSGFSRYAIRWMRRAAVASILLVLLEPVADSLRLTAFSAAVHGREHLMVRIEPMELLSSLLIAGAAWASLWALQEALALRKDLEKFV